jgi:hypothetical protein
MVAVAPMAKKKAGRPRSDVKRGTIVALKGFPEFKVWLDEFAMHCNLTTAETIGQALVVYADKRGFRAPPRR